MWIGQANELTHMLTITTMDEETLSGTGIGYLRHAMKSIKLCNLLINNVASMGAWPILTLEDMAQKKYRIGYRLAWIR